MTNRDIARRLEDCQRGREKYVDFAEKAKQEGDLHRMNNCLQIITIFDSKITELEGRIRDAPDAPKATDQIA